MDTLRCVHDKLLAFSQYLKKCAYGTLYRVRNCFEALPVLKNQEGPLNWEGPVPSVISPRLRGGTLCTVHIKT